MRRSSRWSALSAAVALAASLLAVAGTPAAAYPSTGVRFDGHGWGHGRGLGQYGSLGYAVDEGKTYSWIVDHYYGGTTKGSKADGPITVRLTEFDKIDMVVTSASDFAVDGTSFGAGEFARVRHTDTGYEVMRATSCDDAGTSVAALGSSATPTATTAYTGDDVAKMLNTCGGATGQRRSYRGLLRMVASDTSTWVVNELPMEQYLRGVVPRESPASWADVGGGKGIEALKAQSVAARSYAWAESRSLLFKTCDTISCQVYGGAGLNGARIEDSRSDAAIAATAGEVRMKSGAVARTEFSSSTGGWTAGGTFTAVEDTGDDVSSNPNHDWQTDVPVATIEAAFPEIGTLRSIGVTKRNGLGEDGGRVLEAKLSGTSGSVTLTGNELRSKLQLKSDWYSIAAVPVDVHRLQGTDRYGTAIAVSKDLFADGAAEAAVVVSGVNYPDALVGVPLAAEKSGPILLSAPDAVGQATLDELKRATGGSTTVYLLGGTAALSDAVANQLTTAGYQVVRYGGASRYETAVLVAKALDDPDVLLEATGTGFADALAAGAAAAETGGAVLLTNGSQQAPETAAYLAGRATAKRYAVGGGAAAADRTATPLAGADRYATAVLVADEFFGDHAVAGLASGVNYPDALSGGVHAVAEGGPLLLTAPTALSAPTADHLRNDGAEILRVFVYGGTAAVSEAVATEVKAT